MQINKVHLIDNLKRKICVTNENVMLIKLIEQIMSQNYNSTNISKTIQSKSIFKEKNGFIYI